MKEDILEVDEVLTFDDLEDGEIFRLEEDGNRVLLKINNSANYFYDEICENTVDTETGEMIYISRETKVILIGGYLSVKIYE